MADESIYNHTVASLFDRLIDESPDEQMEARPFRGYSSRALRESVRQEVSRLLNTRSGRFRPDTNGGMRTVLDYGVPDYTAFYPLNQENQQRLKQTLVQTLTVFEPRLRRVTVSMMKVKDQNALLLQIDAILIIESVSEQVSFPIIITNRDSVVEVESSE